MAGVPDTETMVALLAKDVCNKAVTHQLWFVKLLGLFWCRTVALYLEMIRLPGTLVSHYCESQRERGGTGEKISLNE